MRKMLILLALSAFSVLFCQCQSESGTSEEREDREDREELSRPEAKRQILRRLQPGNCSLRRNHYIATGVLGDWNMDVATKIVRAGDTTSFNEQIGFDPGEERSIRACLSSLEKNSYITDVLILVETKNSNSLPPPPHNGEERVYVTFKPTSTFDPFPGSRARCGGGHYPRRYCDPPRLCVEEGLTVSIISIAQEGIRATVRYRYSPVLDENILSAVRPCYDHTDFDRRWRKARSGSRPQRARFIRTDAGWRVQ